jgi:hypothetical protein
MARKVGTNPEHNPTQPSPHRIEPRPRGGALSIPRHAHETRRATSRKPRWPGALFDTRAQEIPTRTPTPTRAGNPEHNAQPEHNAGTHPGSISSMTKYPAPTTHTHPRTPRRRPHNAPNLDHEPRKPAANPQPDTQ